LCNDSILPAARKWTRRLNYETGARSCGTETARMPRWWRSDPRWRVSAAVLVSPP